MFQIDPSWFYVSPWLWVAVVVCIVALTAFAVQRGIKAHRQQIFAGREELVGRTAVVTTALEPKGIVFIEDERWTAILDKGRAKPEEEVIITKVDGLKLYVTKK